MSWIPKDAQYQNLYGIVKCLFFKKLKFNICQGANYMCILHQNIDVFLFTEHSRETFNVLEEQRQDSIMCFVIKEPDPSPGQVLESRTSVNV